MRANEVVTHKPGAYTQIRFSSGERVLVGVAQTGVLISKLLFGFIPIRAVFNWPKKDDELMERVIMFFLAPDPSLGLEAAVTKRLMSDCQSVPDVERLCSSLRPIDGEKAIPDKERREILGVAMRWALVWGIGAFLLTLSMEVSKRYADGVWSAPEKFWEAMLAGPVFAGLAFYYVRRTRLDRAADVWRAKLQAKTKEQMRDFFLRNVAGREK